MCQNENNKCKFITQICSTCKCITENKKNPPSLICFTFLSLKNEINGRRRFFFIFRDKTFAGGTNLCYKFTFIVFVMTPLTLEECLKSPISSICFLFTTVFYLKNFKKSSIYSNCFNSPLIVSFPPFLSKFLGDTISGVNSIYTILIVFFSQISSQITDFF